MSIPFFLAATAGEFSPSSPFPHKIAWMSVHLSLSGSGLSNVPHTLPPGSLIILDDQTPWSGHNLETVCREMVSLLLRTQAYGLLLDFERPVCTETLLLSRALAQCCREIGCPVGAPASYAAEPDMALFISPLPCQVAAEGLRVRDRKLWLDVSPAAYRIHIGADHATGQPIFPAHDFSQHEAVFTDPSLHCQYRSFPVDDGIAVQLLRAPENAIDLVNGLDPDAIQLAIGLLREFCQIYQKRPSQTQGALI